MDRYVYDDEVHETEKYLLVVLTEQQAGEAHPEFLHELLWHLILDLVLLAGLPQIEQVVR
jgi:hypothetical protein